MGLGGLVLQLSGFDIQRATAQPPEVLHTMLVLYVALPVLLWSCGLVFVWCYPLDRRRMQQIRTELEARRGAL
jgi:GPH family glycoside/pentoside/hexuronide:cation symporter